VLALTALCIGVLGGFVPSAEAQTAQFAGAVFSTVAVGSNPSGVAVSPDGSHIYVANHNGGTVSVIATATNTVTATVVVGSGPEGVAVTPDGTHVYVASSIAFYVSVIATATNAEMANIAVGQPIGVAVTPDGTHVYVTNSLYGNTVSVIATATNTVTATVAGESYPYGAAGDGGSRSSSDRPS
jgi:YVTN family beta-propeller protein